MRLTKTMLLGCAAWFGVAFAGDMGVMIENPWIREAPPTAKAVGGFMVVSNHGKQERALVAAESPAFHEVQLHRTEMHGEMAKMVQQTRVALPAGGTVNFEPGGLHIMLMGPKRVLKAGEKVPVSLRFEDGETMQVTFAVRAAGGGMDHGMSHGQMQH
jgi:copper(I)-binding protein